MGKLGRFACILTPMLCTLASLISALLLLLSGTNKSLGGLQPFYHIKIDTRHINTKGSLEVIKGVGATAIKTGMNDTTAKDLGLHDYYNSYLWNYCSGSVKDTNWNIDDCEKPKASYSFNIEEIIKNEGSDKAKDITFPKSVQDVQKAINVVSKFMTACYVLGFTATVVTFLIGWFGLLSRWGSCVTTIFADVAFGFLLIASSCSTALAYSLKGAFNKAFEDFGVEATVGSKWMSCTWICTLFAFGAAVFWLFSTCCCSGRTSKVMNEKSKGKKGTVVESTGGYRRMGSPSPYGNSSTNLPMQPYGGAGAYNPGYEPMRHGQV